MFYYDPSYFLFAIPPLLLGLWAQFKVKSAFNRYSRVQTQSGLNGAETAMRLLQRGGLNNVRIEMTGGMLSDHYDPGSKILRLSHDVYSRSSIASVGVAAHEAGHALQDKSNYFPLAIRSALVPAVSLGSWLGPIIFMIGLFLHGVLGSSLAWAGLLLFGGTSLFAIVTLPVEFDASRRAKELLLSQGILSQREMEGVNAVLDAAALTYVAAAIQSIMQLLYYVMLMNRRDD